MPGDLYWCDLQRKWVPRTKHNEPFYKGDHYARDKEKEADYILSKYRHMLQPCPSPQLDTVPSGIEGMICRDIASRQALGIDKYGTTLADSPEPLREWLAHAYLECLDQANYLRRAIYEMDKKAAADSGAVIFDPPLNTGS